MATPLTAFSKYAGVLMAVMCVLLMFAFVVGDPLMQYANGGSGGGGSSRGGDVVASWNGGTINERQLEQAVVHRNILASFQAAVFQVGARDAMEDGVEDLGLRIQPLDLPRTREQRVEWSVVTSKILAERARKAGMVVGDEMIREYLRALGRDRVSNDEMRAIIANMNVQGGRRATIDFIFELLREAMLANNYLMSHAYAFRTILPEENWEDWKKVNEKVVVEAAPLSITAFIDDAPEPTDAELEAFFNDYKTREPSTEILREVGNVELPSALPAFATPPRVRLTYLKSDFNATVDQLLSEVTDEEIAAFYEENKESFVAADRALFGDSDSIFGDDDTLSEDAAATEGEAGEAEATDEGAMEDAAAEEPAEESPAQEEPAMDEEAAPADEEPATEAAEEEEPVNPLRSEEPATDTAEEEEEEEEADDTPYQPLEEVSEEIRRRLAIDKAAAQLTEKVSRVKNRLLDSYHKYFDAKLEARADGDATATPEPPAALTDLKPLAEEEQLELVEVDQAPQMELRESEIGKSRNTDPSDPNALPTWYLAFRPEDEVDLYEPLVTRDLEGNLYVVLVTERYEGEIPELDDVRDEVVAAWKRTKAAEIALKKAEEIAKAASESGKSLSDYFAAMDDAPVAADDIVETEAFSLFTFGPIAPSAQSIPLRLSQPEPLVAAGPELLQSVFELGDGEVGAQLNHDHSIAYLLRIAQRIGSEEELHREFLRDGDRWLGSSSLLAARMQNKQIALVANLLDESGVDWERAPDQLP